MKPEELKLAGRIVGSLILCVAASVPFGIWQESVSAGVFMFVALWIFDK